MKIEEKKNYQGYNFRKSEEKCNEQVERTLKIEKDSKLIGRQWRKRRRKSR